MFTSHAVSKYHKTVASTRKFTSLGEFQSSWKRGYSENGRVGQGLNNSLFLQSEDKEESPWSFG